MKSRITSALSLYLCLLGQDIAAQPQQLHKLHAADGTAWDIFGHAASQSGSIALVGAPWDDDTGDKSGSAYLFDVTSGQQLFKLVASDGAPEDEFGHAVSVSGNLALIGAYGDDDQGTWAGSAYVFDVATGQQLVKLSPLDGAVGDVFGASVSLCGNLALVGAYGDDDKGVWSGSAYVFDAATGQQLLKLTAADGSPNDQFGGSVSVSGNLALIGASGDTDNGDVSGSAYVFDATTGQQLFKFLPSDGASGDLFGRSVALSGTMALVGAPWDDDDGQASGSAYVFDASTGQQVLKLTASDAEATDWFGDSVAISGETALVSSRLDDDGAYQSGSAYFFDAVSGQQLAKVIASDGASGDNFGWAVSISGDLRLITSDSDDDLGSESGSAYAFRLLPSPFVPYGSGCLGTGGITPQLAMTGFATPGGQVELDILNGVGSGTAFVFFGLQQAALNMGFGCTLNVAPLFPAVLGPVPLFPIGAQGPGAGSISIPATLPPSLTVPVTITLQAFIADPGGAGGFSNSNGIELSIN